MFLSLSLSAKHSKRTSIDTSFIKTFPKALTVKPYLDYKINQFRLDDDITNSQLNYFTYQAPNIGFGAAYKWMSFLAGIAPLYSLDKERKGITKQMDIQWNIYLKALSTDLRYQQYEGYFLNNSEDLLNFNEDSSGHYKRPDLSTTSVGLNLRYTFNSNKFSQKAVYSQTERQLKNSGAFSIGVRWNMLMVEADSSFIPSMITPKFDDFEIELMEIYDQGVGFGYSYSFVKGYWFANISAMPWIIGQSFNFKKVGSEELKKLPSVQFTIQARGAIGFNGKHDYCGIVFVSDQMRSRWKNSHDVSYDFANIKLFYARRFKLN